VASSRTDVATAGGIVLLYLLLAMALLPPTAAVSGLVVFGVVAAVARAMRPGTLPGFSLMVVEFAAAVVLMLPTLAARGGTHPAAAPIGFLGAHAATMLWAALRWRPRPRGAMLTFREAWVFGLGGAALLSVFVAIPIVIGLLIGHPEARPLLWVFPAYLAGFLAAATVFWVLQRIAHLATGRYLLSALAGACVYAAMGPVVTMMRGDPFDAWETLIIGLVLGGFVGPAVAFRWAQD
jgi:hypothetical protein